MLNTINYNKISKQAELLRLFSQIEHETEKDPPENYLMFYAKKLNDHGFYTEANLMLDAPEIYKAARQTKYSFKQLAEMSETERLKILSNLNK